MRNKIIFIAPILIGLLVCYLLKEDTTPKRIINIPYSVGDREWLEDGKKNGITQYIDDPATDEVEYLEIKDFIVGWDRIQVIVEEEK